MSDYGVDGWFNERKQIRLGCLKRLQELKVRVVSQWNETEKKQFTITYGNPGNYTETPLDGIELGDSWFNLRYVYDGTPDGDVPFSIIDGFTQANEIDVEIMNALTSLLFYHLDTVNCLGDNIGDPNIVLMYTWDYLEVDLAELNWIESIGLPLWYNLDLLKKTFTEANKLRHKRAGYVYLLQAVTPHDHFKIGRSKDPVNRIKSMGVKLPFPIKTLHTMKTNDMYKAEKHLHEKYAHKRIEGEWFELDYSDITEICSQSTYFVKKAVL